MENLNKPESTITNQPFFETIFTKHKKVLYALPIVLVGLVIGLYLMKKPNNDQVNSELDNVDLSLPSSQTKELSNDKLDVVNEFNDLSNAKEEESKKGDQFNIEDAMTSIPKGEGEYQNENDKEVVDKVNKMLAEMDKEKKKQNSSSNTAPRVNNYTEKKSPTYESKENVQEDFNAFFAQKTANSSSVNSNTGKQETDPLIYASIKGDHLKLRNNSRVTLILPKETTIKGKVYKKNTLVYAQATFQQNRVNLVINNVNQVPLNLKAYDAEDGNLGMQVQNSIIAETGSEVVRDGVNEVDLNGIPLGNTIKSLFKKKQQEIKVDLLNNQRLILKLAQ